MSDLRRRWRIAAGPNGLLVPGVAGAVALTVTVLTGAALVEMVTGRSTWAPDTLVVGFGAALGAALLAVCLRPRVTDGRVRLVEHRSPDRRVRWAQLFAVDRSRSVAAGLALVAEATAAGVLTAALATGEAWLDAVMCGVLTLGLAGVAVIGLRTGGAARRAVLLTADGVVLRHGGAEGEVPWDRIVEVGTVQRTRRDGAVRHVGLRVRDPEDLVSGSPVLVRNARIAAELDADLVIAEAGLTVEPQLLVDALQYYVHHRAARTELSDHVWAAGSTTPRLHDPRLP